MRPTAVVTKGVGNAVNPLTANLPTTARAGRPAAPNLDYDLPFIPIGTGTAGRGRGAGRIRDAAARRAVVGGHTFARRQPEITARAGVSTPMRGRAPASRRSAAPVGLCSTQSGSTRLTSLPRPSGPTSQRYATRVPLSLVLGPEVCDAALT